MPWQAAAPGIGPGRGGRPNRQSSWNGVAMGSRWEAPRIAYELAVEWAERVEELTVGSGGAFGQNLTEMPLIGKAWGDLRTIERHDVMDALAAQMRSAMWEMRKHNGYGDDRPVIIDIRYYGTRICEQAKETLRALSDPAGAEQWTLPQCAHCADLVATALLDLEVNAIIATGVTDPVPVLRMLVSTQEVPAQREAGDDAGN